MDGFVTGLMVGFSASCFAMITVNYNDESKYLASKMKCETLYGELVEYDRAGEVVCDLKGVKIYTELKSGI
jgi:hypothetical protein